MGYASIVKGNVKKAFNALGDLAQNVTLAQKTVAPFNFATNAPGAATTVTSVIKGVFVQKRGTGKADSKTVITSFMFKAEDLEDPDIYDTITTSAGVVWKMIPPYSSDGFVINVSVAKEM